MLKLFKNQIKVISLVMERELRRDWDRPRLRNSRYRARPVSVTHAKIIRKQVAKQYVQQRTNKSVPEDVREC